MKRVLVILLLAGLSMIGCSKGDPNAAKTPGASGSPTAAGSPAEPARPQAKRPQSIIDMPKEFRDAIDKDDKDTIVKMLKDNPALADSTYRGDMAIIKASHDGRKEAVKALIEAGASLGARSQYGETAIYLDYDNKEVAEALIKAGADVQNFARDDETPLHHSASKGHKEVVTLLLAAGADPHALDRDVKTPLDVAEDEEVKKLLSDAMAKNPKPEVMAMPEELEKALNDRKKEDVEKLITANPELVKSVTKRGSTPLHRARTAEIAEILLANGADLEAKDYYGKTPACTFGWATDSVYGPALKYIITKGANLNATDREGAAGLHRACMHGFSMTATTLMENGADVTIADQDGYTPLHYATSSERIVEKLIEKGADVNAVTNAGDTPLHLAVRYDRDKTVELLLAKGADLNAKDAKGRTPIYAAGMNGARKCIPLLHAAGADINAKDNSGKTVLSRVKSKKTRPVLEKLGTHR